MNIIFITGRLGRDPELKTAQNGTEYTNFPVAVDRRPEKDGTRKTDWFNCAAFGKMAAFVTTYFKKGDGIEIRGRMEDDVYPDKNDPNKKIHSWNVMAESVEFAKGSKKDDTAAQKPVAQTVPAPAPAGTIEDDDIPF